MPHPLSLPFCHSNLTPPPLVSADRVIASLGVESRGVRVGVEGVKKVCSFTQQSLALERDRETVPVENRKPRF